MSAKRSPTPDAASEVKHIDPAVLASLTTGVMLVENGFSAIHEAAEHVLGHPVWTHHFADPALWQRMTALVLAQYPDMPTDKEGARDNWQGIAALVRARYGQTVPVTRGGERPLSPLESIPDGVPVVVVHVDEPRRPSDETREGHRG